MTRPRSPVSWRHGRRPGFALLAVMVIGAMAAVAAATIVTVAVASAGVAGADRRSELARAAADTGLADVLDRLAWGLAGGSDPLVHSSYSASLAGEGAYVVALTLRPPGAGWPLTYDVDHQDIVFLIDGRGHERWIIDGTPSTGGRQPPATLKRFLSAQGRANLASPQAPSWPTRDIDSALGWLLGRPVN